MKNETEVYDGTSWTEVNNLNTARWKSGASNAGSTTASLVFAGETQVTPGLSSALNESWNGTSWTELTDLGQGRYGGGSSGDQTNAMLFGGYFLPTGGTNVNELWNGTSWTEIADLATITYLGGSGGNSASTNAIFMGGNIPSAANNITEEWTQAAAVKTVTTS